MGFGPMDSAVCGTSWLETGKTPRNGANRAQNTSTFFDNPGKVIKELLVTKLVIKSLALTFNQAIFDDLHSSVRGHAQPSYGYTYLEPPPNPTLPERCPRPD